MSTHIPMEPGTSWGDLTIIEKTSKRWGGNVVYKCSCTCGRMCYRPGIRIRSGKAACCGRCAGDTQEARFWSKVQKRTSDQCWPWLGSTHPTGRGHFGWHRKVESSPRVMWHIMTGVWPGSKHVLHTCDNPNCVNPGHLYLGSHMDNMQDKKSRGRNRNQYTT